MIFELKVATNYILKDEYPPNFSFVNACLQKSVTRIYLECVIYLRKEVYVINIRRVSKHVSVKIHQQ